MKKPEVSGSRNRKKVAVMTPIVEPNAAGIDVGSTEMYVAVPTDRDSDSVRRFSTFTNDLVRIADWLKLCGITSVAMESTGVFWIPLFQILEDRGFRVCLVNARHVKNVPGRKTDVADCQWLQYLHSVGLLRASHRPKQAVCAIRSVWRHRESLIQIAAVHTQHMQKALDQMNIQLHHVISDITGVTGLAIIDAVLDGERDPHRLARLRDPRIKASEQVVAEALVGDYRSEHVFVLRQSLKAYRQYQQWIVDCDREIEKQLKQIESKVDPVQQALVSTKESRRRPRGNEAHFDLRNQLYRVFGVDLTEVPGISSLTAHVLLTEVGPDLSRFPSAAAFASWIGLCPDNRISGGKILSVRTRHVVSRLALALRMASQSLYSSRSYLGDYFRRIRTRLGAPAAITAAAHKLARILYHLISCRQPYDESVFSLMEARAQQRQIFVLKKRASAFGFELKPVEVVP
jgi:transposase